MYKLYKRVFRINDDQSMVDYYSTETNVHPRYDQLRNIFNSVANLLKLIRQPNYCLYAAKWHSFKEDDFVTIFPGSKKILAETLKLMKAAYSEVIVGYTIELEFNKGILQYPNISEIELIELTLAKQLAYYMSRNDISAVYELVDYNCTYKVRNEVFPNGYMI